MCDADCLRWKRWERNRTEPGVQRRAEPDARGCFGKPVPTEQPWTDEEVEAMALVLAGECYEDKKQDKRRVCEVILNRVSSDEFDDTIIGVITKSSQFHGYWAQSRPVSDDDRAVAEQALKDWYSEGCAPLSEYLYFEAGDNRENEFRKEFSK